MVRSKTTFNLLQQRDTVRVTFPSDEFRRVIGPAERKGCWVVYGREKNGKTWFTLQLARELAQNEKVDYVSAEEGLDDSFVGAVKRSGITAATHIFWDEYLSVDDIVEKFKKQRSPDVIIIDNMTMYSDELKPTEIKKKLLDKLPNKLIIFVCHEERKEAYPAIAKMAKKLAKVIFHIEGLTAYVTSRFSEGGELVINEQKNEMYGKVKNE
jgi:predicted ATP-dependent serine protease